MHRIDAVVTPLIKQGHLLTRNADLKRKAKFKPRKSHKTQITDREIFQGKTYADFSVLKLSHSEFVEMDTVLSSKGSLKCILTLCFPDTELLLAHLMNRCTPGAVRLVFDQIQKSLGGAYGFISVFPLILTDRGGECGALDRLETDPDGMQRTSIYYCDPMRSNQKGGIENVHTMLRMIFPKGTVFEPLTQWDIKQDSGFQRFLCLGTKNVKAEATLLQAGSVKVCQKSHEKGKRLIFNMKTRKKSCRTTDFSTVVATAPLFNLLIYSFLRTSQPSPLFNETVKSGFSRV